ncbi:MAG: glutathione S-transferase N-terminal domain-containing protein [Paucibacter sp.]|nr:glutathione S-transferase N-terminal domain-containing protein [Roseateles sp.]
MVRSPIRFYRDALSGHCHRVELLMTMLALPFEVVDVNIRRGDLLLPDFVALNRFSQVPVIVDEGEVIADSTAIMVYLAKRYGDERWLPGDPLGAARVQRWLSAASGPVAHGVARARMVSLFDAPFNGPEAIVTGHKFLRVLDAELADRTFLAAEHATIADLACYAYVAHAPEEHVALDDYPHVRRWLAAVEALPRFVPMRRSRPKPFAA